jgi:hypothetical protein
MKSIDQPLRILWFVTLPLTLLAVALVTLLARSPHTGALWMLIISAAVNISFTAYAIIRRQQPATGKFVMISLAAACCLTIAAAALLLDDAALLSGAISLRLAALLLCAVPALYAALALTKAFAPRAEPGKYILGLVALPLAWFLAFNIFTGVRLQTVAMILIIGGAFSAVFLLGRVVSQRSAKPLLPEGRRKRRWIVLYAIFSVALPLTGLMLNLAMGNLFGDFSDPAFYIIPVVNSALLLLPPFADKRLRLLRFFLLSASLVYFIYFFVVFIPFMPIGFLGLIYVVGVLLFAPAGALAMQIIELLREWRQLRPLCGGGRVLAVLLSALLLIPACMLTSYIGDRQNLENATSYLETSEVPSNEPVDLARLERALSSSTGTFEISRDIFAEFTSANNTPLISAAYSALVLNGKVMRDGDIDRLRQLFFDEYESDPWDETVADGLTVNGQAPTNVRLTDIRTETAVDATTGVSRTFVHLTLENPKNSWGDEYVTLFSLPEGAYVSDYYLDVGVTRKQGILADARAAMSVYDDIVRIQQQDPGMLRYIGDSQLELRVFPFSDGETRQTGFEIIHTQPLSLTLDGQTVDISAANTPDEVIFSGGTLVSAAMKQKLPQAKTRPFSYWFIVDSSAHSDVGYQLSLIEDYASMSGINDARVIFASYDLKQTTLTDARSVHVVPHSGFNLALAVKQALTENDSDTVPIILFTSGNPAVALYPAHSAWLAKRFPESPYYYRLRDDLRLTPYAFGSNDTDRALDTPAVFTLRLYGDTFVRDDGQSEIVPSGEGGEFSLSGNQYTDALALNTALRSNPSMSTAVSLKLLRASFRTHVLTPQTSFIVVETAAQEADLWEVQEQLLERDSAIAARETLDEPPLLICLLAVAAISAAALLVRRSKKKSIRQVR